MNTGAQMDLEQDLHEELERLVYASGLLAPILRRWDEITLPHCWLVAGAVAQCVWNDRTGNADGHGLSDIDLVYFDPFDLSEATEAGHAARIGKLFSASGVWLDVKNEARVHLWYAQRFGREIVPYRSMNDAISSFPTTATAIGVQPDAQGLRVYAPFGLDDLFALRVRANRRLITSSLYAQKCEKWRRNWPALQIIAWDDAMDR